MTRCYSSSFTILAQTFALACFLPLSVTAGDTCGASATYTISTSGVATYFSYSLGSSDVIAGRTCSWTFDASGITSLGTTAGYITLTSFYTVLGSSVVYTLNPFLSFLDADGNAVSNFRQVQTLSEKSFLPLKFTMQLSAVNAPAGTSVSFYYTAVSDPSTVYALGCPANAVLLGNRFYVSTDVDGFGLMPLGDNVKCAWSLACSSPAASLVANFSVTSQLQTARYLNEKLGAHIFPLTVRAVGISVSGGLSMNAVCISGTYTVTHSISLAAPKPSTATPQAPPTTNSRIVTVAPAPPSTAAPVATTRNPTSGTGAVASMSPSTGAAPSALPSTTAAPPTLVPATTSLAASTAEPTISPQPTSQPSTTSSCCILSHQPTAPAAPGGRPVTIIMWSASAACPFAQICTWNISSSSVCSQPFSMRIVNASLVTSTGGDGSLALDGTSVLSNLGQQMRTAVVNRTYPSYVVVNAAVHGLASMGMFADCVEQVGGGSTAGLAGAPNTSSGILGMSIALWAILGTVVFTILALFALCCRKRERKTALLDVELALVPPPRAVPPPPKPKTVLPPLPQPTAPNRDFGVKHGVDTWLQHAEDVVAELNQCQLYDHVDRGEAAENNPVGVQPQAAAVPSLAQRRVLRLIEMSESDDDDL